MAKLNVEPSSIKQDEQILQGIFTLDHYCLVVCPENKHLLLPKKQEFQPIRIHLRCPSVSVLLSFYVNIVHVCIVRMPHVAVFLCIAVSSTHMETVVTTVVVSRASSEFPFPSSFLSLSIYNVPKRTGLFYACLSISKQQCISSSTSFCPPIMLYKHLICDM